MSIKKRLSNDIRRIICEKYNSLKPIYQIAEELDLSPKSVSSVIRTYKATGRIFSAMENAGRKKKSTAEISNFIRSKIDDDVSITLKTLKEAVCENFNINMASSTINNCISNFNYSLKKIELVPFARNTTENKEKRFNYAGILTQIPQDKLIFLDECGVNCSLRQKRGRSLRGTTPRKTVRSIRSKNISISAAITKNRVYYFETSMAAYNGEKYESFLTRLIDKLSNDNLKNQYLILDNVPFHKMDRIVELIQSNGHNILFLPPYSPQLNPIEELFSKWKSLIKDANCNDIDELLNAIQTSVLQINENDCVGFFTNMMRYIVNAFNRSDF